MPDPEAASAAAPAARLAGAAVAAAAARRFLGRGARGSALPVRAQRK